MTQETTAIIGVGVAILAVVVPLLLFTLSRVNNLSEAQHRTNEVPLVRRYLRHYERPPCSPVWKRSRLRPKRV